MKNRLIGYLVAAVTLALNYWAFYWIAVLFGSKIPHFIAISLAIAVTVHELGHVIAMEANRIPGMMIFLVIAGGAKPITERDIKKEKALPWANKAAIMLAGVAGNFVIILVAGLIWLLGYITLDTCLRTFNLNAALIMVNLFPIWRFDGGQFASLLFDSIDERRDRKYVTIMATGFVLMMIIVLIVYGRFDPTNFFLFFWGLHYKANHDDPLGSQSSKKIRVRDQKWWAILYFAIIAFGLTVLSSTPNWFLNP